MLFVGNFLVVLGIMMLSLATKYWHVFLSQGICMGLGAGLLYIPSLALVGIWFSRKRSLAMGIVTSGIAVGESPQTPSSEHVFCLRSSLPSVLLTNCLYKAEMSISLPLIA